MVLRKENSFPSENLGSKCDFGGENIFNDLSLAEFLAVRKLKIVFLYQKSVELQIEQVMEKPTQHLSFLILCDPKLTKRCY